VVAGRNEKLRRDLAWRDYRHPTRVLGFATNMHELMAVADLIVTKPGGLTTSEALALGKPLFILNPIPGQEAANSDFLLERGAAAKVNRIEDLPFRLEQLMGSKKLKEMARAARELGHPDAAREVCRQTAARLTRGVSCVPESIASGNAGGF
jgi:processive 1,2-diacylglycerol beta-glucosyltransferase